MRDQQQRENRNFFEYFEQIEEISKAITRRNKQKPPANKQHELARFKMEFSLT